MGKFARQFWHVEVGGLGLSRKDRAGGAYDAYLPDTLAGREFTLEGTVAADVADATTAITRLDLAATALTNTEALARLLLRAESVASSHIEGLRVSPQRLLRADIARAEGTLVHDDTATEVLANVDAMTYAVHGVSGPITVEHILEVHRRLLVPTDRAKHAGIVRDEQNWIGGSDLNPINAAFVPPPPAAVPGLLDDLVAFCDEDTLPAVVQAAIAHAQFETIHPFVDGNGRTGRALMYMILRRRGLAKRTTPPISLALATRAKDYIAGLRATRYVGNASAPSAVAGMNQWIGFFASACTRAVMDAELFEKRVQHLQVEWVGRLSSLRSDSSALALLRHLPEMPVLTVAGAAKRLGRTFAAVSGAVAILVSAEILTPVKEGQRNRVFEARKLIDAFTALERQLASPAGNTRTSAPSRPVPSRAKRSKRASLPG